MKKWIKKFSGRYIDPDGIKRGKNGYNYKNSEFYATYQSVLSKRTVLLKRAGKVEISFPSKQDKPGIIFFDKETKEEFCLKSDQFGFSAPSSNFNHPYDIYLLMVDRENGKRKIEEAKENVENWIKITRQVGGSFLWPMEEKEGGFNLNPQYNTLRGKRSYIQDRVDLTLWELYAIYKSGVLDDSKHHDLNLLEKTILYNTKSYTEKMKRWLSQFGSFEEYVRFFGLSPFIDEKTGRPYDLMSEDLIPLEEKIPKKRILYTDEMNVEKYERLFNRIAEKTIARSKILKGESEIKPCQNTIY